MTWGPLDELPGLNWARRAEMADHHDPAEPVRAAEGDTYELNGDTWTVGPKCDTNAGNWVCTTHGQAFANNFAKDSHLTNTTGVCKLAWNCHTHGPEVP